MHPIVRSLLVESLESRNHFAAYHLTFDDEFNTFNSTKWQTSDFWGMRNNPGDFQAQWFADPTTAPSGFTAYNPFIPTGTGQLNIQAQPTPSGKYSNGLPYVSGQITTAHKFTQRYGYYELKAKLPAGAGLWSRFWFLNDDGTWPGEYDGFEVLGDTLVGSSGTDAAGLIRQSTHFYDPNASSNHGYDTSGYAAGGSMAIDGNFHTYGFLWEQNAVTWYVDGVATEKQVNRINIPMYILIDLAIGNNATGWPGAPNASNTWPANMQLEYFRAYSADRSLPSVIPDSGYTASTLPEGHTVETTTTATVVPSGWTAGDISTTPSYPGSTSWNSTTGELILKGTSYSNGNFQFAKTNLTGDGAIVATIQSSMFINSGTAKSGLMMRENSTRNITFTLNNANNGSTNSTSIVFQANGSTNSTPVTLANITAPVKLRIVRSGNTFTGAYSTNDGLTWTNVASATYTTIASTIQAGLIQGGDNNTLKLMRANFNNVTVATAAPYLGSSANSVASGQSISFAASLYDQLTGASLATGAVIWSVANGNGSIDNNGNYTAGMVGVGSAIIKAVFGIYSVTRKIGLTLPTPWSSTDMKEQLRGSTPPGDTGFASGVWTVVGGGPGISNSSTKDWFRFVSSGLNGNGSYTVKLLSTNGPQAGLIIRDATRDNPSYPRVGATYAGIWRNATGLEWATRETINGNAGSRALVTLATLPIWLRITRSGASSNNFNAFYSTNGNTWTQLGSTRTFTMNTSAEVGLAVASGDALTNSTATFSDLGTNPPTVATPASATPSPVAGTTTILSVLGADDTGEAGLTYTWSLVGTPPASVTYNANGTNAAKTCTATFSASGTYNFLVTITDNSGSSVTSTVPVIVNQSFTGISVTPASANMIANTTQQFTASAKDQFGISMVSQPVFTWTKTSGVGTINSAGLYSALTNTGSATITASSGGFTSLAVSITVTNSAPSVATSAVGTPNPVNGITTALSVLGADDSGESNLTYTWSLIGTPPAAVSYSVNGTNAAKNSTVTFFQSGTYNFLVTITDTGNLSVSSVVSVVVNQKLTSIDLTPANISLSLNATQQFIANAKDQFGIALASQPAFIWTKPSGVGSINTTGLYTAPASSGSATVRASSGITFSPLSSITVTNPAPTVAIPATATPNPVTGTTSSLSVLGNDDTGEAGLTYTWSLTGTPPASVTYSANGTNSAKNCLVTFTASGTYNFLVTITDAGGASATSSVTVTINPTGSISGQVYEDRNSSNSLELGEPILNGVTVYIDANNNNNIDVNEISTVTTGTGNYTFSNLIAGNYNIRQILPNGNMSINAPATIALPAGANFTNYNFANFPTVFTGTNGNDSYTLRTNGSNFEILVGGFLTYSVAQSLIAGFTFNGGGGSDTFTMQGINSSDPISLTSAATITRNGKSFTRSSFENLILNTGNYSISADLGPIDLTINNAVATLTQTQNLASLTLSGGSNLTSDSVNTFAPALNIGGVTVDNSYLSIAPNGGLSGVSQFQSINLIGTSTLNLHDNDLVLDYGPNFSNYAAAVSMVLDGLRLFGGSGTSGITSSEVDAQSISGATLAVVDDGDPNIGGGITSVSGFILTSPATSVIIKYTWFGDANLDGLVDGSDYALTDTGYTASGSIGGWVFGDYDYNGLIDGSDYALIDTGFIAQNEIL